VIADHPGNVKAFEAIAAFMAEDSPIVTLLLCGTTGSGKSIAAGYVIANAPTWILPEGSDALWIQASVAEEFEDWRVIRQRATLTRLLVVNELLPDAGPVGTRHIRELVKERHEKGRRTVVTGNVTGSRKRAEQIADANRMQGADRARFIGECVEARYGDAVWDRLTSAGGLVVRCEGASLRQRGGR